MIKPSIYNAINFTPDFNRESKFFDPSLQRVKNIISVKQEPGDFKYLSFVFKPSIMPEGDDPVATLTTYYEDGTTGTAYSSKITKLAYGYIYFFSIAPQSGEMKIYYSVTIAGYTDICFSEECNFMVYADLAKNSIIEITAYNSDERHGYLTETYPACAFFEYSEFNCRLFGNSKNEYNYSYGRKKILSSENFIKTRLTFCNLTMYQQNLLKFLCNCEVIKINGVQYSLISDFTEKNKDENSEICDLQAEFIEVEQSFFNTGATERPSELEVKNLFIK
jgi:hypothetical protein